MNKIFENDPDWNILKVDELSAWKGNVKDQVNYAYGVFAFDRSLHFHNCSSGPTYEMWRIGTELHAKEEVDEEHRDQLFDAECEAQDFCPPIEYLTVTDVENMVRKNPSLLKKVDLESDEDPVYDITDGWNTGVLCY